MAPDAERIVDSSPQRFNVEFLKIVDADADAEQLQRSLLLNGHATMSMPIHRLLNRTNINQGSTLLSARLLIYKPF